MKLKQRPEDFCVEELTDVAPAGQGVHTLYRLEKRSWATPDAIEAIRRRWKLNWRRISYGGLKDRHALTVQYLTILHGPKRNLTHAGVTLTYLGEVPEPYVSTDIRANRFQITLRDVLPNEIAETQRVLEELRVDGVPNYFDDQRFGSVTENSDFVARLMVLGQYEEALRLALAAPYARDRAPQKQEKTILRKHWGNWPVCKEHLPPGHARILVDYLISSPTDFRGALARLQPELRVLYLSAYQSHLWNRILARLLEHTCRPEQLVRVRLRLGEVPMHRGLDEAQRVALSALQVPLPTARLKIDAADPRTPLIDSVLAEEGLKLSDLKFKGFREMFFSKGERAALCQIASLRSEVEPDDLHAGRVKLLLAFEMPRGAYATLVVKPIQIACDS
jgi:tRNA pseudouridine13 synthase